jgi:protein SCO1/2
VSAASVRLSAALVGVTLLAFGAVMLFAGAAFLRDLAFSLGLSAAWDALCGGPVQISAYARMLFLTGLVTTTLGGVLLTVACPRNRVLVIGAALVSMLVAVAAGYARERQSFVLTPAAPPSGQFTRLDPPRDSGNFFLRNTEGGMTELRDFRGKAVLLFFGYTHCPDVCPTTLSDYKRVKRALGPEADRTAFVFISADGGRDTPEILKQYVELFDKGFVALTAHPSVVVSLLRDLGGDARIEPRAGSNSYKVLHTTDTYLIDPQGRWRAVLPMSMTPEQITVEVKAILAKPQP